MDALVFNNFGLVVFKCIYFGCKCLNLHILLNQMNALIFNNFRLKMFVCVGVTFGVYKEAIYV
jgi:hypothetical protein